MAKPSGKLELLKTMNCEKCQDLISDFVTARLSHEDQLTLTAILKSVFIAPTCATI